VRVFGKDILFEKDLGFRI